MNLDTTTRKLQVVLSGAKTTVDAAVNASFFDVPIATSSIAVLQQPGAFAGTTNGVTAVDIVPAPGANFKRLISEFTVQNQDSAAITVTVQVNDNGTARPLYVSTLQVNDNLEYISGYGFSVTDSTGALKTPSSSAPFSISPTRGIGYGAGAGGAIAQITTRATGVTLNTVTGDITLVSAAGSATPNSFTVTNSSVAALDNVVINQKSGTDLYELFVTAVAAGSFKVTFFTTGGTTTETPVFHFSVIKGANS